MEVVLQPQKKGGFIKRNFIFIAIISIICMFGLKSRTALITSIAIFIAAVFFSSNEDRFCWSLFLIPNIRIYDSLGSTSLVNILICVPFFFYITRKFLRKQSHLNATPLVMAFLLFMMEYMHIMSSNESANSLYGWILGFMWCCYATFDKEVNINRTDIAYALAFGVICSAIIYFVNNPWFASDIINKIKVGHRFEAYANDPNYYSLYICLSLAGIVIKRNLKLFDYMLMLILMGIGLMTASKMCFLLMAVSLFYLIVGTNDTMNKYIRNFLIAVFGCCAIYIMRGYISQFIDILFQRTGGNNMNINTLTTGRYDIVAEYIELLKKDLFTFMFGKGFSYHNYLITSSMHGSHNTYLDFILAWGLSGSIVLFSVIWYWFENYKRRLSAIKYTKNSKYPFFVLALSFFSLSCFSAGMFFFVITFCLLQLEPLIKSSSSTDV